MPEGTNRLKVLAGYLIAAVCLVWVFHDVPLATLSRGLQQLRWRLVGMAVVVDVLSYAVQGLRWRLLLQPLGTVTWLESTQAIYAGLFVNEVLPMRPGELVRAYAVARNLDVSVAAVLPSILIERLFDGVWLATGIGVTAIVVPLPGDLLRAGDVLGLAMLLAVALFLFVVLRPQGPETSTSRSTVMVWLNQLRGGARTIGRRRESYVAFLLSLVLLATQVLAFWLVMQAYGLAPGIGAAAATLIIVHLGTAIPNAPANVGTYQFFCVVALMLFGVEKSIATGFSVAVFVVLTIPLWLLGSVALGRTGIRGRALIR